MNEVDGFFVESRGHLADPPFIRTYWDTLDVPTPRKEKSQPLLFRRALQYVWTPHEKARTG